MFRALILLAHAPHLLAHGPQPIAMAKYTYSIAIKSNDHTLNLTHDPIWTYKDARKMRNKMMSDARKQGFTVREGSIFRCELERTGHRHGIEVFEETNDEELCDTITY